jgi:SAM-dependent methyltransferase
MLEATHIDYGEPIPELSDLFLSVWADHYAMISIMTGGVTTPVLEVGSGFGILAAGIGEKYGCAIVATEHPSRAYLFRSDYADFLKRRGVCLVAHDLSEPLPFRSGSFSLAYFCDVIEHLPPIGVGKVLLELGRVLGPGGRLIVSTPNLNRFGNLIRFLWGHSVNPPVEVPLFGKTLGHIREYAPLELDGLFRAHGFVTEKCLFGINPYFNERLLGRNGNPSTTLTRIVKRLTPVISKFIPWAGDETYVLFKFEGRRAPVATSC